MRNLFYKKESEMFKRLFPYTECGKRFEDNLYVQDHQTQLWGVRYSTGGTFTIPCVSRKKPTQAQHGFCRIENAGCIINEVRFFHLRTKKQTPAGYHLQQISSNLIYGTSRSHRFMLFDLRAKVAYVDKDTPAEQIGDIKLQGYKVVQTTTPMQTQRSSFWGHWDDNTFVYVGMKADNTPSHVLIIDLPKKEIVAHY